MLASQAAVLGTEVPGEGVLDAEALAAVAAVGRMACSNATAGAADEGLVGPVVGLALALGPCLITTVSGRVSNSFETHIDACI